MNHLSSPAPGLRGSSGQICQQHLQAFTLQTAPLLFAFFCKKGIESSLSLAEARRLLQGGASRSHLSFATLPLEKRFTGKRWLTYVCRHLGQRKAS